MTRLPAAGSTTSQEDEAITIRVSIQFFDGCPSWEVARTHLEEAARQLALDLDVETQRVDTLEAAERLGFIGSPTIRIAGKDPFAHPGAAPALVCRLYATPEGLGGAPTTAQLVAVLAKQVQAT